MKILLFDIDSTLLRDGGASTAAFNAAFNEFFGRLPEAVDKHGCTDPFIARTLALATIGRELTPSEDARLHARYIELLPGFLKTSENFRVFPGAREACEELSADPEIALGLQTGNLEKTAYAKLRRAGLEGYFHFGGFGSDAEKRGELVKIAIERGRTFVNHHVPEKEVFLIGDSVLDVKAGIENGIRTIGVATGKDSIDELTDAGAEMVLRDLTEHARLKDFIDDNSDR
jgi:phosphoglycolate phosphatase